MKKQRFVLCSAIALAAFGAGVGFLEIVRWLGAFSEPLKVEIKTPVFWLPPVVEFKPADFVDRPAREEHVEESKDEWSGAGDYYFTGKNPKGFENFDSLSISTHDWNEEKQRMIAVKPTGMIQTYDKNGFAEEYPFSAINFTGKRVSIVTRAVKGLSFQFDGKFVDEKLRFESESGNEYGSNVILKGRLTKWRNGKKIAEAKAEFEMGGC